MFVSQWSRIKNALKSLGQTNNIENNDNAQNRSEQAIEIMYSMGEVPQPVRRTNCFRPLPNTQEEVPISKEKEIEDIYIFQL